MVSEDMSRTASESLIDGSDPVSQEQEQLGQGELGTVTLDQYQDLQKRLDTAERNSRLQQSKADKEIAKRIQQLEEQRAQEDSEETIGTLEESIQPLGRMMVDLSRQVRELQGNAEAASQNSRVDNEAKEFVRGTVGIDPDDSRLDYEILRTGGYEDFVNHAYAVKYNAVPSSPESQSSPQQKQIGGQQPPPGVQPPSSETPASGARGYSTEDSILDDFLTNKLSREDTIKHFRRIGSPLVRNFEP